MGKGRAKGERAYQRPREKVGVTERKVMINTKKNIHLKSEAERTRDKKEWRAHHLVSGKLRNLLCKCCTHFDRLPYQFFTGY